MDEKIRTAIDQIQWFGHASFKLSGSKTIYIDPWKLPEGESGNGDLVLVTHDHYDHCSPMDIKNALGPDGKVLVAECCRRRYPLADHFTLPWVKHNIQGLNIYATAAYNVNKRFHTKDLGHVGYVVELDGVKIYHSGDCDAFPHLSDITCDIALLPVSGTYVMDPLEAANAVDILKPQVAIPMHWGDPDVVGTRSDAERFAELASCEVVILEQVR